MVAKTMRTLGGRILIGYDIGCTFGGTIKRSSLGPEFIAHECRCCVNAFHGYSHSHKCQTVNHPSVVEGAGIEDLETCERFFCSLDGVAIVTRFGMPFHRRQYICLHIMQWDEEKYANLSTMLLNSYKQALGIINDETAEIKGTLEVLQCTEQDLRTWASDEAHYFANLGKVIDDSSVG